MENQFSKATRLAQEINSELGGSDNKINDEVDAIFKVWEEIDPHNAFELFGSLNKIISNKDKMHKLLVIATEKLIEKCPDFYNQIKVNSAAHCYIEVLEEHKLTIPEKKV